MDLIHFFNKIDPLPNEASSLLDKLFKVEKHRKGEVILQPGNLSKKLIFIEKGLIRLFYEKDGKDITFLFKDENSFSMPVESIIHDQPSPYGWEVLEDCTIRVVSYDEINNYMEQIPSLEKVTRVVLFDALLEVSNRLKSIQFLNADERYNMLVETYPNILQRTSLYNISSYLGITQQTLSVIRAKFKKPTQ
jgi:CRP-like cAMP-binding protein